MKNLKTLFYILLVATSITSCSSNEDKSDQTGYPEENPFDAYMKSSAFDQKTGSTKNYLHNYELGFKFKPTVNGKIKAFIVKIPVSNPALRVTLWDASTRQAIKSEIVNVNTADVTIEKVITPILLTKGKEYFITFNSNSWYERNKTDGSSARYPIIAGNITITGYAYVRGAGAVCPNNFDDNFYNGDITFKFQQTE